MSSPIITCVIICYNYGRYLSQAIESCLNQSLDSSLFEILIIDDGSTDETESVCLSYGDKIHVSRSENLGFSKSLERGLLEANGDYIAYMDADDWWHKDKLKLIYSHLGKNVLAVEHNLECVDHEGNLLSKIGARGNTSSICVEKKAALTLMPATSEIFCQPFFKIKKGVSLDQILGYYRIHERAMTDRSENSMHTEFFAKTSYLLAENLFKLVQNIPFWAENSNQVRKLALYYYSEGRIKDFQRSTELKKNRLNSYVKMIIAILRARRGFTNREMRLTGRVILQILMFK